MAKKHHQTESVPAPESAAERAPAFQSFTIAGLTFKVSSPYSAGHVCTEGEARALNQTRVENIRNNLAIKAKDRTLTQADVEAYAASYVFGERSGGSRSHDPVEAEALEIARRLVRKKGQTSKENTNAARELLHSEKGNAIRAQAAKRIAELEELKVA
jgi:hypothetical protein